MLIKGGNDQQAFRSSGRVSGFAPVGPKAKWAAAGFGAQLLAALTAVFSTQRQVERAAVLSD